MLQTNPLASLLRPTTLPDYVGQTHLVGEGAPIRQLCESNKICSMILWGPPGCGKTTLVSLLQSYWKMELISLSAITSGIKDIKAIINSNPNDMFSETKLVFVDEIHRFNKTQQDAFLPHVENGSIILIGATTENPAFSVNSALLSRMRVFTLEPLQEHDLNILSKRALNYLNQLDDSTINIAIADSALKQLNQLSNGDARKLLTTIEVSFELIKAQILNERDDCSPIITKQHIVQASGTTVASFDKNGDQYYDLLSAFHKSVRGSSVDGSLFWFARATLASSDITPICRRLLAIASEDIGNADPKALQVCLNAWDIYHRVGPQEGERAIAQAIIYCALAPKSNAVYSAYKQAKRLAQKYIQSDVPLHLRNATSEITKDLKHGDGYQYAHNYPNAVAPHQTYLPTNVSESNLYEPQERGFEKQLRQKIAFLEAIKHQAGNIK